MRTWMDELRHYGIPGMKWGVRRYQNPDGSLTPKGKRRYDQLKEEKQYWDDRHKDLDSYMEARRAKKGKPAYSDQEAKGKKLAKRFDSAQYELQRAYAKNPTYGRESGIRTTVGDMKATSRKAYMRTPSGKSIRSSQFVFGLFGLAAEASIRSLKSVRADDRFQFYREFGGKRYDEYTAKVAEYEKKAKEAKKGA